MTSSTKSSVSKSPRAVSVEIPKVKLSGAVISGAMLPKAPPIVPPTQEGIAGESIAKDRRRNVSIERIHIRMRHTYMYTL